jgi:hypothetical protein
VEYTPNEPIDPFGLERDLSATMVGAQARIEYQANRSEWGAGISAYDGFRNYASIWIDEYYRQQYSGGGIPGVAYEDPSPKGYGFDLFWKYELAPSSGFLTLSAGFLSDEVAPGYEIMDLGTSFELVRGETRLDSWTGSLAWEGILNRNMRTRQSVRLIDTTNRDVRFSWSGDLNWLLSDRWISRSSASYATEDPRFEAWSISETIEYQLGSQWAINGTFRYYSDTGQIESANLVSSAAPALLSRQIMLSLRYENVAGTTAFSISTGPYETRYGATGIGTERFKNLYSDRNWWWSRFAFRKVF